MLSPTDEVSVVEAPTAEQVRLVGVLGWLVGTLVLLLVLAVGIPLVALTDGGAVATAVVVLVGVGLGLVTVWSAHRSRERARTHPASTTLSRDGVSRTHEGERMAVSWEQVTAVTLARGRSWPAADVVVVSTDPLLALVAGDRKLQARARLNVRQHGGAVVLPVAALPLTTGELGERVAAWSGGTCRLT